MIAKSHRWRKTTMAAAAAALFGLWGSNAVALSLGRITVQSALGEPLRAEIDVPDINAEEAASLKVTAASPEAFQAAGLDYNPAMSGLQATLQRRADGRAYLRLNSDRTINDPFVDVILEVSWASGRIVRDYTLLFDPPNLKKATPAAPTPAQVPTHASTDGPAAPRSTPSTLPAPTATPPVEPRKSVADAPARAVTPQTTKRRTEKVTVRPGDTASKIAAATKPANVSLDQMLVALLRANPTAFMDGNINRVKAGAVIDVPTTEQAAATPATEATQIIVAQSKDFNAFRRHLASSAPSAQPAVADRRASGSVQAQVEDKKPVTTAPDKLTLSKGATQGAATEDQLAKERSVKEAASRVAEIAKNISDLNKLEVASQPVKAAASAPALPVAQAASSPPPIASAAVKRPTPAPVPPPEVNMVDGLIENPLLPAGAVGLIALLAGLGLYRARQRRNAAQLDSVFLESRLQPDSFFAASGGQSVDTSDSAEPASSMLYSSNQLDVAGDVDPIAEADVYLAYGRDLQAEEILRDALSSNPERLALHHKLLEIFAKRRDAKQFEEIATLAFKISGGSGADWARVCELGLSIDPGNALYRPGGQADQQGQSPSPATSLDAPPALTDDAGTPPPLPTDGAVDLDLDFSFDEEPASKATAGNTESDVAPRPDESAPPALDLDFGLAMPAVPSFEPSQPAATTNSVEFSLPGLEISSAGIDDVDLTRPSTNSAEFELQAATSFGSTQPIPPVSSTPDTPPPPTSTPDLSMLEFDLGSLSLDLGDAPMTDASTTADAHEDPLATKLALAEEFSAIGDDDGARALIEEVISEASGDMKLKAQRALSNL